MKNCKEVLTIYNYDGSILDIYQGKDFTVTINNLGDILVTNDKESVIYSRLPYTLKEEAIKND